MSVRFEIGVKIHPNSGLNRLEKALMSLPRDLGDRAMEFAREMVQETFDSEGANPFLGSMWWDPLAERTVKERMAELGPAFGEHPILVRKGELRDSLTDANHPNHVLERKVKPGKYSGLMGTTDFRFQILQEGDNYHLPPRPMWPVGDAEIRFAELLADKLLLEIDKALSHV